jgi:hypothetical protein
VGLFVSASVRFLLVTFLYVVIFNKCFTTDKRVFREPTAKTCEADSGEPSTSVSGYLTSEDVSATTSATRSSRRVKC